MSLLRLKNVSRVFGRLIALQDIDLEMEEGKVYAMIGPNGAGKTTLFNLISGFFRRQPERFGLRTSRSTASLPSNALPRDLCAPSR